MLVIKNFISAVEAQIKSQFINPCFRGSPLLPLFFHAEKATLSVANHRFT